MKHNVQFYYWPIPFRSIFIELTFEYCNIPFERNSADLVYPKQCLEMSFPAMATPLIYLTEEQTYLSQMPAICYYLRAKAKKLPDDHLTIAMEQKVISDCCDFLREISANHGEQQWEHESWTRFSRQRLPRWFELFERLAQDQATTFVTLCIFAAVFPIMARFEGVEEKLQRRFPSLLSSVLTFQRTSLAQRYLARRKDKLQNIYCGGEIELSLENVIGTHGFL